jgi:hypothetical protein|eukprot:COSAG02_NODE_1972_length_10217_cov_140.461653_12_plen_87_part_00
MVSLNATSKRPVHYVPERAVPPQRRTDICAAVNIGASSATASRTTRVELRKVKQKLWEDLDKVFSLDLYRRQRRGGRFCVRVLAAL